VGVVALAHLPVVCESASRQQHTAPSTDPDRATLVLHHCTDDGSVLREQLDQRTLQPDRNAPLETKRQQLPDERGTQRERHTAAQAVGQESPDDTGCRQRSVRCPEDEGELTRFVRMEWHTRQIWIPVQAGQPDPQLPPVEECSFDRPAEDRTTRLLGIIIRIAERRSPAETQSLQELDHLWPVLEESAPAFW